MLHTGCSAHVQPKTGHDVYELSCFPFACNFTFECFLNNRKGLLAHQSLHLFLVLSAKRQVSEVSVW